VKSKKSKKKGHTKKLGEPEKKTQKYSGNIPPMTIGQMGECIETISK